MGQATKANCGPESSFSSVFEGSVEHLNINKLHSTLHASGVTVSQNVPSCSDQYSTESTQPQVENSAELVAGQTNLQSPEAKLVHVLF